MENNIFPRYFAFGENYLKLISEDRCIEVSTRNPLGFTSITVFHHKHFCYDSIPRMGQEISEEFFEQQLFRAQSAINAMIENKKEVQL